MNHDATPKLATYGSAAQALAGRAGIEPDSFARFLGGNIRMLEFGVADAIICAINLPMLWQSDPELSAVYYPGERPPDIGKPFKCAAPDCDEWYSIITFSSSKTYCSPACQVRHRNKIRRKHTTRALECRHGHLRAKTPQVIIQGVSTCSLCRKASQDKWNAIRPSQAKVAA